MNNETEHKDRDCRYCNHCHNIRKAKKGKIEIKKYCDIISEVLDEFVTCGCFEA